jgi:hypothetical protein
MDEKITDRDLEALCKENPLANEQLRRIVAERQKNELIIELARLKSEYGLDDGNG